MKFTLFTASCTGMESNCRYPQKREIQTAQDLKEAVAFDHVCAAYKNSYRSRDNFLWSDVAVMDCDNDHTENPGEWVTGEKLLAMLSGVAVAIVPSRNNGKAKDGRKAKPRFHAYFPIPKLQDEKAYSILKQEIREQFPFFDEAALDSARFLYGSPAESVLWQEGEESILAIFQSTRQEGSIPQGQRNNTMSRFAGRIVKRYGDSERAHSIFLEEANKCNPPLEAEELNKIWQSALRFGKKIAAQEGYVSPDQYNQDFSRGESLRPSDYSDIGQAKVLLREYGNELRYTEEADFIRYNGVYWMESRQAAVGAVEEFLDLQLADATDQTERAVRELVQLGLPQDIVRKGGRALEKIIEVGQQKAYAGYLSAETYRTFVMKRRDIRYILSALQALKPMILLPIQSLDADEFLLNTPSATYDLRKGMEGSREHRAEDFMTKCTTVDPGEEGREIWAKALGEFFTHDQELIQYAQEISGLMAIGKVYVEALVIAYGDGRNGKSTYWNSLARVLGTYCGGISADALTAGCKRNIRPEMAELKGKRMVIAAEMEEGVRLSTSVLKQICSTDEVGGEKKYKAPFQFVPSHTIVLYTNHLPRVGASDEGTWRRLIVIPFTAQFTGKSEVKNYTDYLVEKAGPAILKWIIEGAQRVIEKEYHLEPPKCVRDAIEKYRGQNDWLHHFLDDCCELAPGFQEKSGELYGAYRAYCQQMNEYTRSTSDFYAALESAGFARRRTKVGRFVTGLQLKVSDFLE
ncbi:phage/plasmid primase, P4 family, C-terminal domain-containing protein [Acidaminococcus fermentans]|uniref:Phage/plasmid primase, P4 family, C-terminal domain-containing protein n=1 Tax=Acidaminococcus fermentans TaxID=905 RepID=A0A1H2ZKX8_ACIFE|nr:phage/plasmid primase, P4 family [Acidaminococcus fermentans]SDX17389.1 phage/plasmid primase, P4 family, C-terminal domain-containing protein [Acidaminococcus fermentans]